MTVAVAAWGELGESAGVQSEEARLLARCRSGDRGSQEALVRRYQDAVYRLAYRLLGNPEDALDASQEALVAMLRALCSFRGEVPFEVWLRRLATNVCLMQRRRRRVRARLVGELASEDADEASHEAGPESIALSREVQSAVWEHLRRLPAQFSAVVVLRELEGLSYEEIARTLRIPLGTVQSRLHRARQLLRAAMARDERIPAPKRGK
jgi:RNA polymerase sigma-70 factor (ECF subfamily)